jgi:DNA-binding NarL/FixJ family response regulator
MTLSVLIVDDHLTFADALAAGLGTEEDLDAWVATTPDRARRLLAERCHDVVLIDVDLGGSDGIGFARELLMGDAALRIVILTVDTDVRRVAEAVSAGVCGCVDKSDPIEHLRRVIRGSVRGETWIPPRLLTGVLETLREATGERTEREALLASLTTREREILRCMVEGLPRNAIATRLYLSPNTVRTHVQHLFGKLEVHSTLAAVALARKLGVAVLDEER